MAKFRVVFSDRAFVEEIVEARDRKAAMQTAKERFCDENGIYEVNEWEAELLPAEKYYFRIYRVEPLEE